ncbi:hypothetical protein DITRI_Ditri15bG0007600 [Diplodiscus trichospermus]
MKNNNHLFNGRKFGSNIDVHYMFVLLPASNLHCFILMELKYSPLSFLLNILIFWLIFVRIIQILKSRNHVRKLPPGPWKLPLMGNMHQLVGSLPHQALANLAKKHGALIHLKTGAVSNIVISSPEVAREALKNKDISFASRSCILAAKIMSYDSTNIVFSPYGSYWRNIRKICVTELLSSKRVESFRKVREEEVSNLIKMISLSEGLAINLSKMIFSLTYGITSKAAFGGKCKEQEAFISIVTQVSKLSGRFTIADMYPSVRMLELISGRPKFEKLHKEADRMLEDIIAEHKERRKTIGDGNGEEVKDLVDILLDLQESGELDIPLSADNVKAIILDMLSAGSETSSVTVEWTISELLLNPRIMEKAQNEVRQVFNGRGNVDEADIHELKFLRAVIKETLRLHPSVPLILRECRENCQLNGYDIPVKSKVLINAGAIGKDPNYWNDAETFYPERFLDSSIDFKGTDFRYIPFGAGRRICPGISFAMSNIELTTAQLLFHFDWKLPKGMKPQELDMTEAPGLSIRRKQELFAIPIPYHLSSVQ